MATASERPTADEPRGDPAAPPREVEVDVARTGGFAGMTRRWSAQPAGDEASDWITLLDRCPWDETAPAEPAARAPARPGPVADGFVWWISATWSETPAQVAERREAELREDEVTGAWRDLVEAVRAWNEHGSETPADPERRGR